MMKALRLLYLRIWRVCIHVTLFGVGKPVVVYWRKPGSIIRDNIPSLNPPKISIRIGKLRK